MADNEIPFVAVLCLEGVPTGDGRYLEPGMGSWRQLPQDLYLKDEISPGHDGATIVGRIDSIRMDGRRMIGEGIIDGGTPAGAEYARQLSQNMLRFVSIDMADAEVTVEPVAYDEDGYPTETLARFGPYQIMGATVTSHPAFEQAVIWLKSMPAPAEVFAELPEPLGPPCPMPDIADLPILASAEPTLALIASGQIRPPASWFENPELSELTKVRVTDEGRVYGHLAGWGCCHIGFMNRCVEPPHGTDYAQFLTGYRRTDTGEVATGTITAGGLHADDRLSVQDARAHHDDVSTAVADVTIGEDQFGIWIAGAVRSGASDEQIEMLRASSISGDWRPVRGNLELINIHCVNTPGFPVPTARAVVASGELVALTASVGGYTQTISTTSTNPLPAAEVPVDDPHASAGHIDPTDLVPTVTEPVEPIAEPVDTTEARLAAIEHAISPLLRQQRDEILDRHPAPPEPSPLERYLASRESQND